jgi:hypothetical protein
MVFGRVNFFMSFAGESGTRLWILLLLARRCQNPGKLRSYRRMAILLCFAPFADCIMYMHQERAYSEVMVEQKLGFIGAAVPMRRRLRSAARNRFLVLCCCEISHKAACNRKNITVTSRDSHDSWLLTICLLMRWLHVTRNSVLLFCETRVHSHGRHGLYSLLWPWWLQDVQ